VTPKNDFVIPRASSSGVAGVDAALVSERAIFFFRLLICEFHPGYATCAARIR